MPAREKPEGTLRHIDPQFRVTLPPAVRKALKVKVGDTVGFQIDDSGRVILRRAIVTFD